MLVAFQIVPFTLWKGQQMSLFEGVNNKNMQLDIINEFGTSTKMLLILDFPIEMI